MTIIAYRDGVIAADTQVLDGDLRMGSVIKVGKNKAGWLFGGCGLSSHCQRFLNLWSSHETSCLPFDSDVTFDRVDGKEFLGFAALMCEKEDLIYVYDEDLHPARVRAPFFATGCGAAVALGAMEMGATAEQAVAAAIKYDTGCGGDITVLSCQ